MIYQNGDVMISKLICRIFGCRIPGHDIQYTKYEKGKFTVHFKCARCGVIHYFNQPEQTESPFHQEMANLVGEYDSRFL